MKNKLDMAPNECSCDDCKAMCRRPCWGTPDNINKLIEAGYGDRLMMDYYYHSDGTNEKTLVVSPALKEFEGQKAPFIPRSEQGCTFWKDGLCELHNLGLKPIEGKLASCKQEFTPEDSESVHTQVYQTWKNTEAQHFAKYWKSKYMKEKTEDDPIMDLCGMLDFFAEYT